MPLVTDVCIVANGRIPGHRLNTPAIEALAEETGNGGRATPPQVATEVDCTQDVADAGGL